MQSEEGTQEPPQIGYCDNQNIAILTRKERDWLLGKLDLSKSYEYRLKSSIKKKLQTFMHAELPLLFKSGLFPALADNQEIEPWTGFGDGNYINYDSSLGKAKVPGPNPGQGSLFCQKEPESCSSLLKLLCTVFVLTVSVSQKLNHSKSRT